MPTVRVLRSIAHNIAHHAASALSFLHPHSAEFTIRQGLPFLILDLLAENPVRNAVEGSPLSLASQTLVEKFRDILTKAGFGLDSLTKAQLEMRFPKDDVYFCETVCEIITTDGKHFRGVSSSAG